MKSPQLSLFKAEQTQLPQPFLQDRSYFLIIFVFLYWAHTRSSMSLLYCEPQNWTQHQGPQPAGNTFCNSFWDAIGFPGHKGKLLARGQAIEGLEQGIL